MAIVSMRTIVNIAGTVYDALKTSVIFAEDMNKLKSNIEDLDSRIPDVSGLVPNTRTVNGHALTSDVTVTKSDVGLGNVDNTSDKAKNNVYTASDGSTVTFDIDTNGGLQKVVLGGNRTLAFTITTNRTFALILTQDGTGSRTVTWPSGILWAGGSAPTLTTTLNKSDTVVLIRTGSGAYLGFVAGQNA